MEYKKTLKKYIYMRDDGKCYFCGKKLTFKQGSIDHYLPVSKGGPEDVFNLVLSCKDCNRYKKDSIPADAFELIIELFKQAADDGVIDLRTVKLNNEQFKTFASEVKKVEALGEYTVFQSSSQRYYIKNNRLVKFVFLRAEG